ncbi:hypothetical protein [Thermococcus henrietii]|uniref:hypothetical protein n=1 Tax=Thermococcus henrietii TaxID=2016361 RepID=UPI000C08250F|nr:hypothetical protein [Thermococcus henrietii]
MFAVLLGLLMVEVTARSAAAAPIHNQPSPKDFPGLGAVISTSLKGPGVIAGDTNWLPQLGKIRMYVVIRHNGIGAIHVTVLKWIPLGGYFTAAIFPDMTTYTNGFKGKHFKRDYIHTYTVNGHTFKVLTAEYSSWFSFGGWWEQKVKFDAGYGTHGILVMGYTNWPWLQNFLGAIGVGKAANWAGKKILQFVTEGSTEGLASAIGYLLSGVTIDVALFMEK